MLVVVSSEAALSSFDEDPTLMSMVSFLFSTQSLGQFDFVPGVPVGIEGVPRRIEILHLSGVSHKVKRLENTVRHQHLLAIHLGILDARI